MIIFRGLYRQENHLINKDPNFILDKLKEKTAAPSRKNRSNSKNILFHGHFSEDSFELFKNSQSPQFLIPIFRGEFVTGENETLLNLKIFLNKEARVFVYFWTILCLISSLYCLFLLNNIYYGAISILILIINYWIVRANFQMHSKQMSMEILEIIKT